MIRKLVRRMTILVAAVLVLITAGIVLSINMMNRNNIRVQAKEALAVLAENSGARPSIKKSMQPSWPVHGPEDSTELAAPREDGDTSGPLALPEREGRGELGGSPGTPSDRRGQPIDTEDNLANLSNSYVVTISEEGEIEKWTSDREDLYTDGQVQELTALALSSGKKFGRIGTQYYSLVSKSGKQLLIVLDERLEILNAQKVLRSTLLVASLACLLLIIGARVLIRRMVRPVEEAFNRQKQFVWDASHELKTPLAVIGANADVLEGDIGENEHLGYIRSEVRRTNLLVQDLLTLARMDQGSGNIEMKEIDLSNTVLSVILPFESKVFEAGKALETDVPDNIVCTGNAAMIEQLIVILLSNALKYSDEKGTISVSVRKNRHLREIRVSNTGEGIQAEDLNRIFDRFYRADTSHNREIEGFGLGLSIAARIMEAHKGRIRVESEPGKRTTFVAEW